MRWSGATVEFCRPWPSVCDNAAGAQTLSEWQTVVCQNFQFCGYSALSTRPLRLMRPSQLQRLCAPIVHAKISPSDLKGRCFYFVAPERLRSQGPDYRRQGRDPLTCCDPHTGARRSGPGCLPMTMHCKYAVTGADFCYRSYASMGHRGRRGGRVGGVLWPAAFLNDALAMQLPLISTAMQCDCVVKISGTAAIFFFFRLKQKCSEVLRRSWSHWLLIRAAAVFWQHSQ